ncbi:MAG: hypothetical protein AAGA10_17115 [Bacteroidota bacterium]
MKNHILSFCVLLLLSYWSPAQRLSWLESNDDPGNESVFSRSLIHTAQNEIYVAGEMEQVIHFNSWKQVTSSARSTAFLTRYDNTGAYVWYARLLSTSGTVDVTTLGTQPEEYSDGILVTGNYTKSLQIEGSNGGRSTGRRVISIPNNTRGAYVAKYQHQGYIFWAHNFFPINSAEGEGDDSNFQNFVEISDLTVDKVDGSYYLLGTFQGSVDFDPHPSRTHTVESIRNSFGDYEKSGFIAHFDQFGNFQWLRKVETLVGSFRVHQVATYRTNNTPRVVVLHSYWDEITLVPGGTILGQDLNNLLLTYDGNGNLLNYGVIPLGFIRGEREFKHLEVDDQGGIYLGGITEDLNYGSASYPGVGATFMKLNANYFHKWSRNYDKYIGIRDMKLARRDKLVYTGEYDFNRYVGFEKYAFSELVANHVQFGGWPPTVGGTYWFYENTYMTKGWDINGGYLSPFFPLNPNAISISGDLVVIGGSRTGGINFDLLETETSYGESIRTVQSRLDFFLAQYDLQNGLLIPFANTSRLSEESEPTSLTSIQTFPNPVSERLWIQFPATKDKTAECVLRDVHGRIVWYKGINLADSTPTKAYLELSKLAIAPGFYTLDVNGESLHFSEKIIVK